MVSRSLIENISYEVSKSTRHPCSKCPCVAKSWRTSVGRASVGLVRIPKVKLLGIESTGSMGV